jgi:DNA topoisomerase-1
MAPARFDTTRVDIGADQYVLRATGSVLRFDGFYRVWEREAEGDEASGIPELEAGDGLQLLDLLSEQHFTQPPPRYTEASLIKELEERGIGRPSTYAPTIETIEKRAYVKVVERRLHPTPLGKAVTAFLVANLGHIFEYAFTANMEGDLDKIEEGGAWVPFMRDFNQELNRLLKDAQGAEPVRPTAERTGEACPKCHEGELVKREGRYGEFVGCSRYPLCDYIQDDRPRFQPVPTGRMCPDCGRELVQRQGRRGPFVGCSGYPECKFVEKDGPAAENGAASAGGGTPMAEEGTTCPKCGEGKLARKRGRFGEFLGCSRYPDCKYIHGQRQRAEPQPTGATCPECGKPLVLRQGRRGPFVGCSGYPKCRFIDKAESDAAKAEPAGKGVTSS